MHSAIFHFFQNQVFKTGYALFLNCLKSGVTLFLNQFKSYSSGPPDSWSAFCALL